MSRDSSRNSSRVPRGFSSDRLIKAGGDDPYDVHLDAHVYERLLKQRALLVKSLAFIEGELVRFAPLKFVEVLEDGNFDDREPESVSRSDLQALRSPWSSSDDS